MLADARSLLFVPGHRGERFTKAAAAGADLVCIDLEDAVPPPERSAARAAVASYLGTLPPGHAVGVRVSATTQADGLRDLLSLHDGLAAAQGRPAFVMMAKTDSAAAVEMVAALLPGVPLIALVETARALAALDAIAASHPSLQALMLGGADLAADLGCAFAWEPLLYARSRLVVAAAGHGLACIDVPFLDVGDADGAQAETRRVAALGFTGKALIHPSQVAPVHAGFAPSADELARARRVVAASAASVGAVLVDGRMIDRPVVLAAERVLRRAAT